MDEIEALKAQIAQLERDLADTQTAYVEAEERWKVELAALQTRNQLHAELMAILDSPSPLQQAHLDQIAASHAARPLIRVIDMRAREAQRLALIESDAALRAQVDLLDAALEAAEADATALRAEVDRLAAPKLVAAGTGGASETNVVAPAGRGAGA